MTSVQPGRFHAGPGCSAVLTVSHKMWPSETVNKDGCSSAANLCILCGSPFHIAISISVFLPVALRAQGESRPSQLSGLVTFPPHYNG